MSGSGLRRTREARSQWRASGAGSQRQFGVWNISRVRRDCRRWAGLLCRRLRGDSSIHISISQVGAREDGSRLSSAVPRDSVRSNGHKPKHRKFHLDMGKNFTVRVAEQCHSLPGKVMDSSALETLKTCIDTFWYNLLRLTLPCQRAWSGLISPEVFSNPNCSVSPCHFRF